MLLTGAVMFSTTASAVSVSRSVELSVPAKSAWALVREFDAVHKWHPAYTHSQLGSGVKGRSGAVRVVAMRDGPSFSEELLSYSESGMHYRYRMLAGPLPFRNYVATISVRGNGKKATVTWKADFQVAGKDARSREADVRLLVEHWVRVGLQNLKKLA